MAKVEVNDGKTSKNYNLRCPRCNSNNIHIEKRGFSSSDACCGVALCGPLGLLCGGSGSEKLRGTCMNCGKKFDAESQIEKRWNQKQKKNP